MLEVSNGEVLHVEEITTLVQTAVVKKHHCMLRKINTIATTATIATGEALEISFQWQKYSLETERYEPDLTTDEIIFQVSGQEPDTLQPVGGQDTLKFSSLEPGTYTIKTLNAGVDNAALEVTVNV